MTATASAPPTVTAAVTRQLAEFLAAAVYLDLPPAVLDETDRATLDWFGSALAGAIEPPARAAQRVALSLGASSDATMLGVGRASAAAAAFANGVASHILELDDVHKGSTLHAAAPVISAALGVAEREHASGRAFSLAVALGYEAALRIGEAVNPSHYRFWHPTGTAATFGAAAAAGSIDGLTAAQMLDALGTAGTQAAGLWEFNADGAMSKHLHPGKAALNGILAADLARVGFTGATRILEGDRGFFRATTSAHDATRITDGIGRRWKITENCYKLHSCCGHTHSAIDVALDVRSQRGWLTTEALSAVSRVDVETYGPGYEIVRELNPRTPYAAKFSLAYCVAAALLEGRVNLEQFGEDRFGEDGVVQPEIAAFLPRIHVAVREDLTAKYPAAWPTRVTISLTDGTKLRRESDYPRGNPENPVTTPALEAKFLELVGRRFGDRFAEKALAAVQSLHDSEDVSRVFAELPVPPTT
jgi:2-methylcitrate dehydratase PrpD